MLKMLKISRRLQLLVDRHQILDDQIDELSNRPIIFPMERESLKELKVIRLRAKEAIDRFKKEEGLAE
jgi:hypothetical protein